MTAAVDSMIADAVGREVTRISFDFQTRLLLDGGWEIVIGSTASWTGVDGEPTTFDGEEARVVAVEFIGLRGTAVTGIAVDMATSTLTVEVDGGALVVGPDPQYEAWEVLGPNGIKIIASPGGGEPSVWSGVS